MSRALSWKEAAKSAICWDESWAASSEDGVEMGRFSSFWTARRTAVLGPEKEKSRGFSSLGRGNLYLSGLPLVATLAIAGPPG